MPTARRVPATIHPLGAALPSRDATRLRLLGVAWTRPTSEAALRSFTFSAACHRLCHPSSISLKKRHVVRAYVGNYMIMWDKQYNKVLLSYLSV